MNEIKRRIRKDNRLVTDEEISNVLEMYSSLLNQIETDNNIKAKAIAAYVRSHMEDFHCENLSDDQMRELNPIIRNAIFTALEDICNKPGSVFLNYTINVQDYWEDCVYLE